jgi:nitrous oxidase accessory protein NosD
MRARSTALPRRTAALLALVVGAAGVAAPTRAARAAPPPKEITIDHDDVDVVEDVVVRKGTYRVRDADGDGVLRVRAKGVTVVLDGVVIDGAAEGETPDRFEGVGVSVVGVPGVTVRGGSVRGFRVGVRGEKAPGLRLIGVDASGTRRMHLKSTPEREDPSDWLWPHENDAGEWETRYGGGFSLTACEGATLARCRARTGQNGVLLSRCDGASVVDGDFSLNSGWGVALWRTRKAEVLRNRCDRCVRGYSHGRYARGQDSAGILMFEQCYDNVVARNGATHSGDGFFLYAGHETTKKTGAGGCNRNRVAGNDFSHAVANGIEATFSAENVFVANRLDDCEHGVWAGYSRKTSVSGNSIRGGANGVSIEHGTENEIALNDLAGCGVGVHLWWDPDPDLVEGVYGRNQDTRSARNQVYGNRITGGGTAILLDGDRDSTVRDNRIASAAVAFEARGVTAGLSFRGNSVVGPEMGLGGPSVLVLETKGALAFGANWWGGTPPTLRGAQTATFEPALTEALPPFRRIAADPREIPARGEQDAFLPEGAPRGRSTILVDDWGPVDPTTIRLFPERQTAAGTAAVHVLGAGTAFRVAELTPGFVAEPPSGTAPATVRIRRAPGSPPPALSSFAIQVVCGDATLRAAGTIVSTTWSVRWWAWKEDPRKSEDAWRRTLSTPPLDRATMDALDATWGDGSPTPLVPADRFATVAETTVTLPAGDYVLRTLSDDGIRVSVDGKIVLSDWTWHAPKEASVTVPLPAGPHAIRVEHFEIDGFAALRCTVEPAGP